MKRNKVMTTGLGLLIAVAGLTGVTACSSDSGSKDTETAVTADVTVDVAEDLQNARNAVEEALADDPSWAQVMLASDVDAPTQKYGLLVMPYIQSDASARVTGTVAIDGGNYTIEAESAATGETWQIDQDGAITQVTE